MAPDPGLVLEPVATSAREARRYVRAELTRLGQQDLTEAAELGVSELTTNVALHARTAFTVTVSLTAAHAVRISVTDSSPLLPERRHNGRFAGTGRGLRLLDAAGRWGVDPLTDGRGKTVWFEPDAQPHEDAFGDLSALQGLAL